jgi:hypothetical protein
MEAATGSASREPAPIVDGGDGLAIELVNTIVKRSQELELLWGSIPSALFIDSDTQLLAESTWLIQELAGQLRLKASMR